MVITGERRDEGGMRSVPRKDNTALCFGQQSNGQYRLRPLYYVSDKDKQWYKEYYSIKYSDAYEVYGLTRTGCCGCPISYKAVDDLEKIRPFEPNVVKAAWNIFGKSYEYRAKYNQYKAERMETERKKKEDVNMANDTVEKIPKSDISVVHQYSIGDIDKHYKALDKAVKAYKKSSIDIALNLYWLDEVGDCNNSHVDGVFYKNIAEFASDKYGISKATTYQYIAIVKKFGKINPETGFIDKLDDKYKDYSSTALIVMSGMNDDQLSLCKPDMKVKELQAIRSGLSLEDKSKDPKKSEPKKDKPKQSSNSTILYEICSVDEFDLQSVDIVKNLRRVLRQDNGTKYHISISMTWN